KKKNLRCGSAAAHPWPPYQPQPPAHSHRPTTATMCPSPPLPTVSPLLRTSHQCQPSPSSSSIKLGTTLFFNNATVDRAAESSVMINPGKWGSQLEKRRKRRRRRRRRREGFERLEPEEDENIDQEVERSNVPVGASRSGFLSRLEEVQLCLYLKEGAILENLGPSAADNEIVSVLLSNTGKGKKKRSAYEILCRRREAREKITRFYRRLVCLYCHRIPMQRVDLQDLIQEGSIGLLRGAERFDPERGNKLSTYVYWWIKIQTGHP
ncbi:unnamed protein product, partial [Brassica oleracea]